MPWTLAHARRVATTATVSGTDEAQADKPHFTVRLTTAKVTPIGAPARKGRWLHFAVRARGVDPDTGLLLPVSFVLHATGPQTYELTGFHGPPPDRSTPAFPLRVSFEFGWYPEAWSRDAGATVFSRFQPSLGLYDSSSRRLAAQHIAAMRYGNIVAGVYSWRGVDSPTDRRFATYLDAARQTPFRWAAYYELEGYGDPSVEQIRSDLHYLRDRYFSLPAYLRVGGRPVVFVYGDGAQNCSVAARWAEANDVGAYVQLYTPSFYPSRATELRTIPAFTPAVESGIQVAAGDLTGDRRAEIVTAADSSLKTFDPGGALVGSNAAPPDARVAVAGGNVFVAGEGTRIAAGDLTGDGRPETVTAHAGHVEIKDASTQATLNAFDVAGFGDAFVAVGDVDGDGRGEVVVASGRDVPPHVEVVDVNGTIRYGPWPAYFPEMLGGMNVATGDTDGDGVDEIVLGADRGGSATETWRIAAGAPQRVAAFFGWDSQSGPWGTRLAVADVDGNGVDEVILGGGPGRPSEVKVYGGYLECARQPDAWHQYVLPFGGGARFGRDTYVATPGFWMAADQEPRLARDVARWRENVRAMAASGAPWQLVISFNEWPEGTAVESAAEWATPSGYGAYLDVLHEVR
jgi:hypothetical protein